MLGLCVQLCIRIVKLTTQSKILYVLQTHWNKTGLNPSEEMSGEWLHAAHKVLFWYKITNNSFKITASRGKLQLLKTTGT